jgi:16S rRNA (uracil1498-N3)-methyltransferase
LSPPLFLVDAAASIGQLVSLTGPEGRHAGRVQRLRAGETCLLSDGAGWIGSGQVETVSATGVDVRVQTEQQLSAPTPQVCVVQALPKGERADLTVAMLTEAGVDRIVPWSAERCVARWTGDKVQRGRDRWVATARESTKQSRRPFVPEVAELAGTGAVVDLCATADLALVLEAGVPTSIVDVDVPDSGRVLVVVGPEGGLTAGERTQLVGAGALEVRLGPQVLRTSTAGPIAVALLQSRTRRWAGTYSWVS